MTSPERTAVVLAGGYGERYERGEKFLAMLAGDPLLAHVLAGVAPAVDAAIVSCRDDQLAEFAPVLEDAPLPVTTATDPEPDRGPAAGLATALEVVSTPLVAVVAADMPFVDADFLRALFDGVAGSDSGGDTAERGGPDGAVPAVDGHPQPTHAVFRTERLRAALDATLAAGDGSLRGALDRLDYTVVPQSTVRSLTDRRTFVDVNTAEDLAEAWRIATGDGEPQW